MGTSGVGAEYTLRALGAACAQPAPVGEPEEPAEPQVDIRIDRSLTADDVADARRRHADLLGQAMPREHPAGARNHYPAAHCEKRSNPADHPGKFALFVPGRRSGGDVSTAGTPASLGGGGHRLQTESGVECEDYQPAKYRHGSDLADRWNAQKSCITVSMRGAESGAPLLWQRQRMARS